MGRHTLVILVVIVAMAFLFSWPLLTRLEHTGIWDWSEATAHYEATRLTVFDYGQFPLWNPYMCGGGPALANPQTYWLSLTGLFAMVFGSVIGPKLAVPLYILIGAIGTYLLTRRVGVRRQAALLAIPIFLTSGYLATHLSAGQFLWLNLAWVPWIVWSFLRANENWRWLIVGAAFLAIIGLEGRSYLIAYVGIFLFSLGIVWDLVEKKKGEATIRAGVLLAMAFGLAAWKFVPDLLFLSQSQAQLANSPAVPWSLLPKIFLLRDVTPNAEHARDYLTEMLPWFEFGYYLGVVPLLLALAGIWRALRAKKYLPWFIVGGVFFAIVMSNPDSSLLEKIPLLSELRNQQRAASLLILALGVLAAIGFDWLLTLLPKKVNRTAPLIVAAVLIYIVIDLALVTAPALKQGYAKGIEGDGIPPTKEILFEQHEGLNDPWPVVRRNLGAAKFCPAILYAWYEEGPVYPASREGYKGEVYFVGEGRVLNYNLTPNIILARVKTTEATRLVINQNANPGWKTNVGSIVSGEAGELLAVDLPAGEHDVEIKYTPPGIGWGALVTGITVAGLVGIALERRQRVGPGAGNQEQQGEDEEE